jgi:hypothetical protein
VVSAASSRRLLACLVGAGVLALLVTARAEAGYGVAPGNGQTFTVSSDSVGSITDPSTLDFVVYLDAEDSDPYVWISESPQMHGGGTPAGGSVASCAAFELIPFGEQNKWVCRASTILMKPGRTYYWWLDFRRRDPGANVTTDRISGPFSFTLTAVQPPPSEEDPHEGVSSKTVESAATLPGATVFDGARSIKHTKLTQLVYRTMKEFGLPRSLAFACWSPTDWLAVLAAEGAEPTNGSSVLLGFWLRRQPRWLHLAPRVCTDVQALLTSRLPNARRAGALSTVIHETLHAYGVENEAMTNCFAVQLVPHFGLNLGMSRPRALYLGTLARNYVRGRSPSGYWNGARCRESGEWDLFPDYRNFG